MDKNKHSPIVLSKETHGRLKLYAKAYGYKVGALAEKILTQYLDRKNFLKKKSLNKLKKSVKEVGDEKDLHITAGSGDVAG